MDRFPIHRPTKLRAKKTGASRYTKPRAAASDSLLQSGNFAERRFQNRLRASRETPRNYRAALSLRVPEAELNSGAYATGSSNWLLLQALAKTGPPFENPKAEGRDPNSIFD